MMKRTIGSRILLLGLALSVCSCGPNRQILESANQNRASNEAVAINSNSSPAASGFEQDLSAMRTADFKFILVFRRKDGQVMEAADKELISRNTGFQANRRRLSDDGKAVIIGGNFPFATALMNELTQKYKMENYSKPDSGPVVSNAVPTR